MNTRKIQWLLFGGTILSICTYAFILIYLSWPITDYSLTKAGVFGDSFGILTSLFSALAFAGMIVTILLQKEELTLQRQELADTRKELEEQKEIFQKQSFNDTFFHLLDYYKQNLCDISVTDKLNNEEKRGVSALKFLIEKFTTVQSEYANFYDVNHAEKIKVFEYHLFINIQQVLMRQSRYLTTFEGLLRLVSNHASGDKKIYWDIINSQLTVHERKYIFYHSLVNNGGDFGKLVNESGIIASDSVNIYMPKSHLKIYCKIYNITISSARPIFTKPHLRKEIRRIKKELAAKT